MQVLRCGVCIDMCYGVWVCACTCVGVCMYMCVCVFYICFPPNQRETSLVPVHKPKVLKGSRAISAMAPGGIWPFWRAMIRANVEIRNAMWYL